MTGYREGECLFKDISQHTGVGLREKGKNLGKSDRKLEWRSVFTENGSIFHWRYNGLDYRLRFKDRIN